MFLGWITTSKLAEQSDASQRKRRALGLLSAANPSPSPEFVLVPVDVDHPTRNRGRPHRTTNPVFLGTLSSCIRGASSMVSKVDPSSNHLDNC